VRFWDIDVGDIFLAIPFALLLTILFYFDHNGMSCPSILICTTANLISSLLSYCPRNRIPPQKTGWLPLGPLASRSHNIRSGPARNPLPERTNPASAFPHSRSMRHSPSCR
jgi:hypothetical protein